MGFSKDDPYPCLLIDSTSEEMPSAELSDKNRILAYLFNSGLIGNYKNHSPWEKAGLSFVDDELKPMIDDIFTNFVPLL